MDITELVIQYTHIILMVFTFRRAYQRAESKCNGCDGLYR